MSGRPGGGGPAAGSAGPAGAPARPMGPGRGGMGFGLPAAKPKDFRGSFRRLVGTLRPEAPLIAGVILLAIVSVTFTVVGPKILGNAVNTIFEGAISRNLPAGATQEQVIAAARAAGNDQLADMLATMHLTPGTGIDFGELVQALKSVCQALSDRTIRGIRQKARQ